MIYGAYLEDYHLIKVILPSDIDIKTIHLKGVDIHTTLEVYKSEIFSKERHLFASFKGYVSLQKDYYVVVNNAIKYQLFLGKITRTKRFDFEYYTDEWLGYKYTKKATTFRIWSPVAKVVKLVCNNSEYYLNYTTKGVWETTLEGDFELCQYYYEVRVNDKFNKCLDPYAKASTPNFLANVVIDFSKTYKVKNHYRHVNDFNYVDCVIEEVSLRDITSSTILDVINSKDSNIGLGYLKNLGVTHLQFMPFFGFGGVDEVKKDDYNWGYNPVCYQTISNYLASAPFNPCSGINEMKELIDIVHSFGMGVCMDVVFNHVYEVSTYPFGTLVPGYAYHTDDKGFLTEVSGCGNDVNTEKSMVRRFIIDTLKYFQSEFKIDGFRFDLMNLIDVDTLNQASSILKLNNDNSFVYGEGWNMPCSLPSIKCGKAENFFLLPDYAFFNDFFRNSLKNNFEGTKRGFALGEHYNHELMYTLLTGCCLNEEKYNLPKFSINYVECHDNHTFYDVLMIMMQGISKEEAIDRIILSISMIAIAQGIPFYHLGQEYGRTKKGIDNSYKSSLSINGIDYNRQNDFLPSILAFKEVLSLRRKYDFFRLRTVSEIRRRVKFIDNLDILTIQYDNNYYLYVKNDYSSYKIDYKMEVLFDGRANVSLVCDDYYINKPGIYLVKRI